MLISEVIDGVKAYCGHDWGGPIMDDTTRDQVLWGPVDVECTGIVTTCFASADVIRQAHARGANLIICHEALFWNHGDHTCWLAGNKTFAAKRALLEECGITVWRLHDHIHSGIPEDGRLVDGIFMGLADKLGWRDYVRGDTVRPMEFEIPETSAGELARFLVGRLGLAGTRIVGDADARVRTVLVPMHLIGQFDDATTARMDSGFDCLVTMGGHRLHDLRVRARLRAARPRQGHDLHRPLQRGGAGHGVHAALASPGYRRGRAGLLRGLRRPLDLRDGLAGRQAFKRSWPSAPLSFKNR